MHLHDYRITVLLKLLAAYASCSCKITVAGLSCSIQDLYEEALTGVTSRSEGCGTQTVSAIGVPGSETLAGKTPRRGKIADITTFRSRQRGVCMHRRWKATECASDQSKQQHAAVFRMF